MKPFNCDPYWMQDKAEERRREEAAYQDAVEEEQGRKAWDMYQNLPDGIRAIFSSKMNALFGELFDTDSDVDGHVNDLLYQLCLMKVQRQEAV
ncbi:hypothetical protein FE392_18010 [Xenorhabdus sp. 12]|uniref:Uncharacterized protein n=1 Tax=Xenorhabdus santafensis TaxID=2582833 RepID=A0ABU4SEE9_9GAMM|nr:hypothetical protein [Xenorhabdus sp. 12]MDX7989181.1 hypothetical protein [Xenorhabdus sp. 12]